MDVVKDSGKGKTHRLTVHKGKAISVDLRLSQDTKKGTPTFIL